MREFGTQDVFDPSPRCRGSARPNESKIRSPEIRESRAGFGPWNSRARSKRPEDPRHACQTRRSAGPGDGFWPVESEARSKPQQVPPVRTRRANGRSPHRSRGSKPQQVAPLVALLNEHPEACTRSVVSRQRFEPQALLARRGQRSGPLQCSVAPQPGGLRLVEHGTQPGRLTRGRIAPKSTSTVMSWVPAPRAGRLPGVRRGTCAAEEPAQVALGPALAVVEDVQPAARELARPASSAARSGPARPAARARQQARPRSARRSPAARPGVDSAAHPHEVRRGRRPRPAAPRASAARAPGTHRAPRSRRSRPRHGPELVERTCRAPGSRVRCCAASPSARSHSTSSSGRSRERLGEARPRACRRPDRPRRR